MTGISLIALSPLQGAEGELKHYIKSNPQWRSALSLIIPIHSFRESFPKDRIDPAKLKILPPLILSGPVERNGDTVLKLESQPAPSPESYSRMIHGKELPPLTENGPFSWNGLLLNPAGLTLIPGEDNSANEPCRFQFERWQIGMYRILYNEKRQWWEDVRIRCLWKIRKGRS